MRRLRRQRAGLIWCPTQRIGTDSSRQKRCLRAQFHQQPQDFTAFHLYLSYVRCGVAMSSLLKVSGWLRMGCHQLSEESTGHWGRPCSSEMSRMRDFKAKESRRAKRIENICRQGKPLGGQKVKVSKCQNWDRRSLVNETTFSSRDLKMPKGGVINTNDLRSHEGTDGLFWCVDIARKAKGTA